MRMQKANSKIKHCKATMDRFTITYGHFQYITFSEPPTHPYFPK